MITAVASSLLNRYLPHRLPLHFHYIHLLHHRNHRHLRQSISYHCDRASALLIVGFPASTWAKEGSLFVRVALAALPRIQLPQIPLCRLYPFHRGPLVC